MNNKLLYQGGTLGDILISSLARFPDAIAFKDEETGISYAQLAVKIGRLLRLFAQCGLRRGDTLAQLSVNRHETFVVVAATIIAGVRLVSLQAMGGEDDHAYIVDDCGAKLVVVDASHGARGQVLKARCLKVEHWAAHGSVDGMEDLWALCAPLDPMVLEAGGGAEDIIRLSYTGGTTGRPKGVMLSNRALCTQNLLMLSGMDWPALPHALCATPISHGASALIIPTLMRGGTVTLQRGFDVHKVLNAIAQDGCNVTFLVPTTIYALLDHPRTRSTDLSAMKTLIYSAAPMAPARVQEALEVFGPCLVQLYGQTEAPSAILALTQRDHLSGSPARFACAGKPLPGLRVALLDDAGHEVAEGEVGEVCVRGPLVMSGYWNQPDQTAQAFRGDWLHTGDMGSRDGDGFLRLVDRKKDMIISGGFNVYSQEVENVLAAHEAVAAVAVIGIPDDKWGEAVKAFVQLKPGQSVEAATLIALVRAAKGTVYAPKSVAFEDRLPLTPVGKIDKKALRSRYWGEGARAIH